MARSAEYLAQFQNAPVENTGRTGGFAGALPTKTAKPVQAPRQNLIQKINDVSTQTLDIGAAAIAKTGQFIRNTAVDVGKAAVGAARTARDISSQPLQNKRLTQVSQDLSAQQDALVKQYKNGEISKANYIRGLEDLSYAFQTVSNEARKISGGPTPVQRAYEVAETAVNALTLGRGTLAKAGGKQAFEAGVINGTKAIDRNAINALVDTVATKWEKNLFSIAPSSRSLVERNLYALAKREGEKLAGESVSQFLSREGRNLAVGLLIKRPIFYQQNVGGAKDVYDKILSGDYPAAVRSAAWLGAQMIDGGPIGIFSKGGSWLKRGLGELAQGRGSYIDELSKRIGNGDPNQMRNFILESNGKLAKVDFNKGFFDPEKTARIAQETNLRATNNDVLQAVENTLANYDQTGISRSEITPKMILEDLNKWASADAALVAHIKNGKITGYDPTDLDKLAVVRWDSVTKTGLANTIRKAGDDKRAQIAALFEMAERPGVGFGGNSLLMGRLKNIIETSNSADEAAKAIQDIATASIKAKGVSKALSDDIAKLGYIIAEPFGGNKIPRVDYTDVAGATRKLVSGAVDNDATIFDPSIAPQPVFEFMDQALSRIGLSPRASSAVGSRKLAESIVANLDQTGLTTNLGITGRGDTINGGRAVLSRLQEYVEKKPAAFGLGKSAAITDIRQLRTHEIQEALGVTKEQAKGIYSAIVKGYIDVPMEFRGLADKVLDHTYAFNPLQKYYSRIQSALRYTYNPFFRTQERVETTLLGRAQARNPLWNRPRSVLQDAVKDLEEAKVFSSSFSGVGAEDQIIGRITANITGGQKRSLAGLALDMADARGLSLKEMLAQHSDEVEDALRIVVQYPRTGTIASPLARTLNLMFFPMRYNAKVTTLAAQQLGKMPPSVQMAVLHSGFKMREWLKSEEGIRWQSQHADAIQVFKWVTPVNSIEYTMNLLNGTLDSPSELGALGGLPFGFISQMLDSQGVIKLNTPYVNPKTGDVLPEYIPKTVRARASVAIVDLLGSMFSYPGRTLGLPGKNATLKKLVNDFVTTNGSDFEKRVDMDRLTPLQKKYIEILKGDLSDDALDDLYNMPAPGQFNGYTIPPMTLPLVPKRPPVQQRTGLPSSKSGPRAKKRPIPIPER